MDFYFMSALPVYIYAQQVHSLNLQRPQGTRTPRTELQIVVNCHLGAGNHTNSSVRAASILHPDSTPQPRQPQFDSEVRL